MFLVSENYMYFTVTGWSVLGDLDQLIDGDVQVKSDRTQREIDNSYFFIWGLQNAFLINWLIKQEEYQ